MKYDPLTKGRIFTFNTNARALVRGRIFCT